MMWHSLSFSLYFLPLTHLQGSLTVRNITPEVSEGVDDDTEDEVEDDDDDHEEEQQVVYNPGCKKWLLGKERERVQSGVNLGAEWGCL